MPRSKRNTTKSPVAARKSPRAAAAVTETKEETKPTRSRSSRGSTASESPTPKKSRRGSPSPAPAKRESRGRSAKKPEESPASKAKGRGQGDNEVETSAKKGRVTRAIVQEAEVTSRGRSRGRAAPPAEEPPKSRARTPAKKEKAKPATPSKTSKGRSASRSSSKSTPSKKATGSTSRSRSRGKKDAQEESEMPSAQIVLTKCDSPVKTPDKKTTAASKGTESSEKSRSRSRGRQTPSKATPKSSPSPRVKAAAKQPSPSSRPRRGRKSEEAEEKEDKQVEEETEDAETKEEMDEEKEDKQVAEEIEDAETKQEEMDEEKDEEVETTEEKVEEIEKTEGKVKEVEETEEKMEEVEKTEDENTQEKTEADEDTEEKTEEDEKVEEEKMEEDDDVESEQEEALEEKDESVKTKQDDEIDEKEEDTAMEETSQPVETKEENKEVEDRTESMEHDAEDKEGEVEDGDESSEEHVDIDKKEEEDVEPEPVKDTEMEEEEEEPAEDEAAEEELTQEKEVVEDVVEESKDEDVKPESSESVEEEAKQEEIVGETPLPNDAAAAEEPVVEQTALEPEEEKEVSQEQNSVPEVNTEANGGALDTNLVSPSRKRKHDDADDLADDLLPKKIRRSLDATDVSCEDVVKENGENICSDQPMETEVMETTPNMEVQADSSADVVKSVEETNVESEYVVIEMKDIPAADSEEVQQSLPSQETAVNPEVEATPETQVNTETEQATSVNDSVVTQDTSPSEGSSVLFSRKFIPNPSFKSVGSEKQFSVCSYNILAQCHLERNDYSFTEPQYLNEGHRHSKLMKEVEYLDADVVCMQEVGPAYYDSLLCPHMQRLGYQGLMKKRTEDYYDEGEATFYKTSRFTLVESQTYTMKDLGNQELQGGAVSEEVESAIKKYLDLPDVLIITKLKCNNTGSLLTLGNVHIQWGRMEMPDAQCIQIVCAIKELVKQAGSDSQALVLCGDFNSEVTSPGYKLATEGYLSDDGLKQLQALENLEMADGSKAALVNHLWRAFQHTSNLKSAYAVTQELEPKITSYNKVMLAAVDYIFYSAGSLDTVGVLQTASPEQITGTGGIPDETFPSDHVSIKAVLSFT